MSLQVREAMYTALQQLNLTPYHMGMSIAVCIVDRHLQKHSGSRQDGN
jgi:hypothetical protein